MMDGDIYGEGNAYTAEYWEYDPRLGRRWNVDPVTYAWQSSYAAFNNNPIYFVDPLGLEGEKPEGGRTKAPLRSALATALNWLSTAAHNVGAFFTGGAYHISTAQTRYKNNSGAESGSEGSCKESNNNGERNDDNRQCPIYHFSISGFYISFS